MRYVLTFLIFASLVLMPRVSLAEVLHGTVIFASEPVDTTIEGFNIGSFEQDLRVVFDDGEIVEFLNDFTAVRTGQKVYVNRDVDPDFGTYFSLYAVDRSGVIFLVFAIFVLLVLGINFRKGIKSLTSLALTIIVVFWLLLPAIKSGFSPTIAGSAIAIVLLALVMLFTHGFHVKTFVAMAGTSLAIVVTALMTYTVLTTGTFTGLGTDEAFAVLTSGMQIDMVELLFVGILVGMLGILDDVAITQASVVVQLHRAGVRGRALFVQAMQIGQDHIGALVNTLVLAYTGTALPLLLLTTLKEESLPAILSIENVASEIIRALMGSIGVILTVPLTTFLAVLFIQRMHDADDESSTHDGHVH